MDTAALRPAPDGPGILAGLSLLTKHSAVLLIPMLFLLALADAWLEKCDRREAARRALNNLSAVAAIFVIAAATIWCGYGVSYSGGTRVGEVSAIGQQRTTSAEVRFLKAVRSAHLMPKDYLDGLIEVRALLTDPTESVEILGLRYAEAPWFYLPVTTLIKFTVSFLVMLVIGGAGVFAIRREQRREILFMLLPALLYLASRMRVQRTAIGIWHLFPMVPFLLIAAASGCVHFARRYRWAGATLVCLLLLHCVLSLRAYPNYLSYANELWGGPQNLYKHLPWTDVNQTYWEVARYMEQHPDTPCWVNSDWRVPADKYKVPCTQMGSHWVTSLPKRMKGIVFISSSWLQIDGHPGDPLAPFYVLEPKARLGGSAMLVYEGEFETGAAAARALDHKALSLGADREKEALDLAKQAVDLAQYSPFAHYFYCGELASNGYPQDGLSQCSIAHDLALANHSSLEVHAIERQIKIIAAYFDLPLPPSVH